MTSPIGAILSAARKRFADLLLFFVVGVALGLACGCSSPMRSARVAIDISAQAVATADQTYALAYAAQARDALEESATLLEYEYRMTRWNRGETALRVARHALVLVQTSIDAWENGDRGGFDAAVPCLLSALVTVRDALTDAGVDLPSSIDDAIDLLSAFGGQCSGLTSFTPARRTL